MLRIAKNKVKEETLSKMAVFDDEEGALTEERERPKVRVRHPRIVTNAERETEAVREEEEDVFSFKGRNLFSLPEVDEAVDDDMIDFFEERGEVAEPLLGGSNERELHPSDSVSELPSSTAQEQRLEESALGQGIPPASSLAENSPVESLELVEELPDVSSPVIEVPAVKKEYYDIRANVIKSIETFQKLNTGLCVTDVEISYNADDVSKIELLRDGSILLPNQRVYFGPIAEDWDSLFEVRVPRGKECELELGVHFALPDNYAIEFSGNDLMRDKHGLELADGKVLLTRQEALLPIVIRLRSISDVSYIAKYSKIIQCKLKQLD